MAKTYKSEITEFIQEFKQAHPDTDSKQREGRARLWDKPIDSEIQEGYRAAKLPQPPYVYYSE